jgi:hypothetical protein
VKLEAKKSLVDNIEKNKPNIISCIIFKRKGGELPFVSFTNGHDIYFGTGTIPRKVLRVPNS